MTAVVIALLPAAGFGIYNFGPRALAVMAVTIASTVLTELLFGWLWKKKITTPIVTIRLLKNLKRSFCSKTIAG